MSISFPISPIENQIFTVGNKSWIWNGYAWDILSQDVSAIYTQANAAYSQANTGTSIAQNAYNQANTGTSIAQSAYGQANTGTSIAQSAYGQANTGTSIAQSAYGQANTGTSIAQSAYGQANTGTSIAQSAYGQANSAYGQANTGTSIAQSAYGQANTAYGQANTGTSIAQSAYGQANSAYTQANSAYGQANTGTSIARSAYGQANTAYGQANSAYNQANTSTTIAQSAYNQANSAYTTANTKFNSSGGNITGQVTISSNLLVTGNLTVSGNVTAVSANNLSIKDNMIYLNDGANTANPDLGFAGNYNDGIYRHAGFFRDASDGVWKVFDQYLPEPDASPYIDTSNSSFRIADFQANNATFGKITTSSTALVSNLNVDLLDGQHGSYYTTAGNLTGTIPSSVLGNSTHYVGTTAIALNRASGSQSLTGISSIDGSAASLTTARTLTIGSTGKSFNGTGDVSWSLSEIGVTGALSAYLPLSGGTLTGRVVQSASGFHVATKDDITTRTDSGFFQTSTASIAEGWPADSTWYHLLTSTHSNDANYFSMQFAGDFYNSNNLFYRATNGSGTTGWNKIWHAGNDGSGSGLDADLLDGLNSDKFVRTDSPSVISVNSSSDALRITQTGSGNALVVEDSANPDSTPFVVEATGDVLIGTATAIPGAFSDTGRLQIAQNTGEAIQQNFTFTNSSGGSFLYLNKSRSGTIGTNTIVQSGDILGGIVFAGADGTTYHRAAQIFAEVDGTPGTNDMPGRLVFSTTADGASSPTERMRIDSSGNVGIGSTNITQFNFRLSNAITGATSAQAIRADGTIQSGVTSEATYIQARSSTVAAAFTLSEIAVFSVSQGTFGAGSAVTTQYGYKVDSSLTGATNNYGFYSNIASGTGRWNFYAAGTAGNYFAGSVSIAATIDSALTVSGGVSLGSTTTTTSNRIYSGINWNFSPLSIIRNASNSTTPRLISFMLDGDSLSSTTIGEFNAIWGIYDSSPTTGSTSAALNGKMGYGAYSGHIWYTNGTERMRIDSSGKVGIGTSSPAQILSVAGTLGVSETGSTGGRLLISTSSSGAIINQNDNSPMSLQTLGTTALRIAYNQNVAIGYTSDQSYKLAVNGSFAATTKSFVIDHPTKPNKKLRYGSLESPYHGVRLTGEAILKEETIRVYLPEYIHGLCKQEGAQVQITNIKHGKVLWVEDINVEEDYFEVSCEREILDNKEYKFYWSFTAIRKDIEDMVVEFDIEQCLE